MAFNFGTEPLIEQAFFEAVTGKKEVALEADEKLQTECIVQAATAQIRSFCSSHLSAASYVEVWDANGGDVLIPSEIPITSVTSIKISHDGNFTDVQALDSADFVLHPSKQFLSLRHMRFPRGRGMVQISYNAGYSSIPKDIQMAISLQFMYLLKTKDTPGVKQITKMNESQHWDDKLSEYGIAPTIASMLSPYRRMEAPLSVMFSRVC